MRSLTTCDRPVSGPPEAERDSHVRLIAEVPESARARAVLMELAVLREDNALGVLELAQQMRHLAVHFPRARPLVREVLYDRYEDLRLVAWAMAAVERELAGPGLATLTATPEAADYFRGLYAWSHAVGRALLGLAADLRHGGPDWAMYRFRVEEASQFVFDELEGTLLDAVRAGDDARSQGLRDAYAALFLAVREVRERLDQRVA
jgi:hypothetical protein